MVAGPLDLVLASGLSTTEGTTKRQKGGVGIRDYILNHRSICSSEDRSVVLFAGAGKNAMPGNSCCRSSSAAAGTSSKCRAGSVSPTKATGSEAVGS